MSNQIVCPSCAAINRVPADKPANAAKCGKCKTLLFSGKPIELTDANFSKFISKKLNSCCGGFLGRMVRAVQDDGVGICQGGIRA